MSKHHSTVTRRDFMKGLGLAGAGLGAAAAVAPVFHDMDEILAAPTSMQKRPWFVKEQDKPTIEIDLSLRTPYHILNSVLAGISWGGIKAQTIKQYGQENWDAIVALGRERKKNSILNNVPGCTLRDHALADGIRSFKEFIPKPLAGHQKNLTPEQRGVPRWEGTPEENSRMVRTIIRSVGASQVGFIDLDDTSYGDDIRKLWYSHMVDLGAYVPVVPDGDIDTYYIDGGGTYHIPKKCHYYIYYQPQNSRLLKNGAPLQKLVNAGGQAARDTFMSTQIQNVLWGLGYQSYTQPSATCPGPPMAILCGVNEYCRLHNGISYELGAMMGGSGIITDLPVAPTKPIDMGIVNWCRICRKCADVCPGQAIDHEKELTWERNTGPWNAANDHTGWRNNSFECMHARRELPNSSFCVQCSAVCPFSKEKTSWIHDTTKAIVSFNSQPLDSVMLSLDDFFGYGSTDLWVDNPERVEEDLWNKPWPEYLIDPIVKDY